MLVHQRVYQPPFGELFFVHLSRFNEGRVVVTFRAAGAMRFPWGHASGPLMLQHLNLYHLADAWTEHVALLK